MTQRLSEKRNAWFYKAKCLLHHTSNAVQSDGKKLDNNASHLDLVYKNIFHLSGVNIVDKMLFYHSFKRKTNR